MLRSGKRCCVQRSNPVPSGLTEWTPYFLMYYCFWILLASKKNTPIGHQNLISEQNALLLLLPETLLSVKTCHKMQHKIVFVWKAMPNIYWKTKKLYLKARLPSFSRFPSSCFWSVKSFSSFLLLVTELAWSERKLRGREDEEKTQTYENEFPWSARTGGKHHKDRGKKTWEIEAPCGHFFDELHEKKTLRFGAMKWS